MVDKAELKDWVVEALQAHNGEAHHIQVAKYVWENYESRLKESGNRLFTWQYDLRWAAQDLRNTGVCKPDSETRRGVWALA